MYGAAGQRRTDKYFGKTSSFYIISFFFGNQKSSLVNYFSIFIFNILCQYTPTDIFGKRNFHSGNIFPGNYSAFFGTAIFFGNYNILGHINKPSSQIPSLGGIKSSIRSSLTSSVRNHEILNRRKPLLITRNNRKFQSFALIVLDESDHPGHLHKARHIAASLGSKQIVSRTFFVESFR